MQAWTSLRGILFPLTLRDYLPILLDGCFVFPQKLRRQAIFTRSKPSTKWGESICL
jgi:hypothetical protein